MPRAHLSKRLPDADAIRLFAEHHISQVRRRRNGEILAVKHVAYGWISPGTFYALGKVHEAMPVILKLLEGGYRLKQAIWSFSLEIPVIGVTVPVGMLLPAGAIYGAIQAWSWADQLDEGLWPFSGSPTEAQRANFHAVADTFRRVAVTDVAAVVLPFGDVWLLWVQIYGLMVAAGILPETQAAIPESSPVAPPESASG